MKYIYLIYVNENWAVNHKLLLRIRFRETG